MAKRPSSQRWLQRQHKDPYVKQAQKDHYRSRAVYKLIEIDQRDHLFKPKQVVIDLGAAPGSWSQYVSECIGSQGRLIAVDILPMGDIANTLIIQGDFGEDSIYQQCLEVAGSQQVDLVISDIAPNLTGIRSVDQCRIMGLVELVTDFAYAVLKPGGDLLVKIFEGSGVAEYKQALRQHFIKVHTRKPGASRDDSREHYVLARSYRV